MEKAQPMTTEQALLELQAPDPKARMRAMRWLRVRGGPKAIEALIGALDDADEDVRLRALDSLWEMKAGEAVPALIERLQSDQATGWKWNYIFALRQIGDRQAVPALIAALNDPDERIVSHACEALRSFGEMEAVEPLLGLLDDPHWLIRKAACEALFKQEVTDDRLVAALERLAQEPPPPSPNWRRLAEEAGVESPQYPWLDALAGFASALEPWRPSGNSIPARTP